MRKKIFLIRSGLWDLPDFPHPLQSDPPLGLQYAASLLNKDGCYATRIFDCTVDRVSPQRLASKISLESPLAIIISSACFNHRKTWEFARQLKAADSRVVIIASGHDATAREQVYLSKQSPFDIVLKNEFEDIVVDVINKLRVSGDINEAKKIYEKHLEDTSADKSFDLDKLFYLEHTPEELKKYNFIYPVRLNRKILCGYIMSSRGCVHDCIFCSQAVRKTFTRDMHFRTAANVVDEAEKLVTQGVNLISFLDDNFSGLRAHVLSICREIIKRKLKIHWVASCRIDELDGVLLGIMKEAGCILLLLSVESGQERIIRNLNKTAAPAAWVNKTRSVFAACRELGIETCALFMVGCPDETEADIEQSINLAKELRPAFIKVHFFTPYPGTAIYHKVKDSVPEEKIDLMHHYLPPVVNLSAMDMSRLKMVQRHFYKEFFLRPEYIALHLIKYSLFYIYNIRVFRMISRYIFKVIKGHLIADKGAVKIN